MCHVDVLIGDLDVRRNPSTPQSFFTYGGTQYGNFQFFWHTERISMTEQMEKLFSAVQAFFTNYVI
jgi:hypothetical protein